MTSQQIIAGCLQRIQRGYMDGFGVLADHLDETGHPLARKVRALYAKWLNHVAGYRSGRWKPRRKLSRWEEIALWHRDTRRDIAGLFRRKWKGMKLACYAHKNPGDFEPLSVEDADTIRAVSFAMTD